MTLDSLGRLLAPISRRISLVVSRAIVRLVSDAAGYQRLQLSILSDEVRDNIERLQNYGFTSHPKLGAEAIVLFVGADRGHGVAVVVDDRRYRKANLAQGEVAMFTDEGDFIHMKRGRIIEVVAGTKLKVTAPACEITGNVSMTGDLSVGGSLSVTGASTLTGAVAAGSAITAGGAVSGTGLSDGTSTLAAVRSAYNGHVHPENNGTGGPNTGPTTSTV